MKPSIPLGPWPQGIDQVSGVQTLLTDENRKVVALRDAQNVDIDRAGRAQRRRGATLVTAQPGLGSLWGCALGAFAQVGTALYSVNVDGALAQIATLNSADPCSYCVLNAAVIVSNRTTLLQVNGSAVVPLGVSDVSPPLLSVDPAGGLPAGRYSVACSFVAPSGYEGGVSPIRTINVPDGGGILCTQFPNAPDAALVRVYRTATNGETLFHVFDVLPGTASALIGAGHSKKEAPTQWLRRMRPGSLVGAWRGRLLTAQGKNLYISQPMNYGLYSPRHGFVQFPSRITMLAPVDSGIYVGTQDGVTLLIGDSPKKWEQVTCDAQPPIPGTYAEIDGSLLSPDLQTGSQRNAIWLAPNGYCIGRGHVTRMNAADAVIEAQANRINAVSGSSGQTIVFNRRVRTVIAA